MDTLEQEIELIQGGDLTSESSPHALNYDVTQHGFIRYNSSEEDGGQVEETAHIIGAVPVGYDVIKLNEGNLVLSDRFEFEKGLLRFGIGCAKDAESADNARAEIARLQGIQDEGKLQLLYLTEHLVEGGKVQVREEIVKLVPLDDIVAYQRT